MKPVYQTKFGSRDGNCFAACLATLMELPIEEIAVQVDGGAEEWFETVQSFLKPRNLFYLEVRIDVSVNYPLYAMQNIPCLMIGKSPRFETLHCVVGTLEYNAPENKIEYNFIHDPMRGRRFIDSIVGLGFLAKLDWSKS